MSTTQQIWDKVGTAISDAVKESMRDAGRIASGRTADNIEVVPSDSGVKILAPLSIDALEYGRGPTSPGAPKGDPTLLQVIQEWCKTRGIEDAAAYPITQKIHKQGFKGTPGVITGPLSEENMSMAIDPALEEIAEMLGQQAAKIIADALTAV